MAVIEGLARQAAIARAFDELVQVSAVRGGRRRGNRRNHGEQERGRTSPSATQLVAERCEASVLASSLSALSASIHPLDSAIGWLGDLAAEGCDVVHDGGGHERCAGGVDEELAAG